jgi:hypothetical protein
VADRYRKPKEKPVRFVCDIPAEDKLYIINLAEETGFSYGWVIEQLVKMHKESKSLTKVVQHVVSPPRIQ